MKNTLSGNTKSMNLIMYDSYIYRYISELYTNIYKGKTLAMIRIYIYYTIILYSHSNIIFWGQAKMSVVIYAYYIGVVNATIIINR